MNQNNHIYQNKQNKNKALQKFVFDLHTQTNVQYETNKKKYYKNKYKII